MSGLDALQEPSKLLVRSSRPDRTTVRLRESRLDDRVRDVLLAPLLQRDPPVLGLEVPLLREKPHPDESADRPVLTPEF